MVMTIITLLFYTKVGQLPAPRSPAPRSAAPCQVPPGHMPRQVKSPPGHLPPRSTAPPPVKLPHTPQCTTNYISYFIFTELHSYSLSIT